jgi:hypothetical protein
MRVASSAKRTGGLDPLLIDGRIEKTPWYLSAAIHHAVTILSWMELPDDKRPPEEIWLHPELLEEHFERVFPKNEEEGVEKVPMMSNELTKGIRG